MHCQVDGRCRSVGSETCTNGKGHRGIHQRCSDTAVQNPARLPKVVTHPDRDDCLIELKIIKLHTDKPGKRQAMQGICGKLFMRFGYLDYSCGVVHPVNYICLKNRKIAGVRESFFADLTKAFKVLNLNIAKRMDTNGNNLKRWQRRYLIGAALIAPFSPFLYLQGQYTRWKVGVLPDAGGPTTGRTGEGDEARLFVIGESTVAGLGARSHEVALAGQFAKNLAEKIGRPVEWTVVGKSGVTARQAIDELLPQMPAGRFDFILVGLGGNDVLKLSTPARWRADMSELLATLRAANPDAIIFLSNCPMVCLSPALPNPLRAILWELSKLHNDNIMELTSRMERVFY